MIRTALLICSLFAFLTSLSCSTADDQELLVDPEEQIENPETPDGPEEPEDAEEEPEACADPADFLFEESQGLILVEFEKGAFETDSAWEFIEDEAASDGRYAVWTGANSFSNPGNGLITYQLDISNPGTYRFIWKSAVTEGDNGTESNDSWLRFADTADFYGEKNGSRVYPRGSGKTPNPEGASKDGWFKIYRSGNDLDFKWQARTSDNDAHDIYVVFEAPGTYLMEVSGRSRGHAIDQFVLYQENQYTQQEATSSTEFSRISCN
ncbi:hypothetical protein [Croceiramulus getboli]|nr:hypothetical protein P8624_14065 [Flavobacteriaceae bacterium YJPT1-3]